MNHFNELNITPPLLQALKELGFEKPTPIQVQTLPILLEQPTDFIGEAATGTGKTAAFAIPLLEQIDPQKKQVQGLILCPTRELVLQVTDQINKLGKYKGVKALSIYGGTSYNEQIRGLNSGSQIVVGTPGRVIDHLERKRLKLNHLTKVILDEADEMISMGFKESLETILKSVPREQSHFWLFSATMSKEVHRVASIYLQNPQKAKANPHEMLSTTVEQFYYPVHESDKPELLCRLIEFADEFYGLIFCQTKSLVLEVKQFLSERGFQVDSLHGDKSQSEREKTLQAFRERKVNLLICTDVASRGLDVKNITHVINYSIPRELESYIHRIGRTARSGKQGIAMSLVTPSHRGLIRRIEHLTKSRIKEGKIPTQQNINTKKIIKIFNQFQLQNNFENAAQLIGPEWNELINTMPVQEVIARFLKLISPELFIKKELQTLVNLKSRHSQEHPTEHKTRKKFKPHSRPHPPKKSFSKRNEKKHHHSQRVQNPVQSQKNKSQHRSKHQEFQNS